MKNKKGFTLIELLAVIVILGLLMAIAIPSVTKYITESRKKTVISTIGNYITAMVNEVNDLTYTFTGDNTIYAVPIECIALERGGTNPFGAWHQANDAYWAYVLVQYNDDTSSYTYGYTFKDSAGYGLYPTAQDQLNESGKQILTNLSVSKPKNGKITKITNIGNWNGFKIDETTNLVVLTAESEGEVGNGESTCTLQQKGENYQEVEANKLIKGTLINKNADINKEDVDINDVFGKKMSKNEIEAIYTVNYSDCSSDAIDSWDASAEGNGKVMAWITDVDKDNLYELYLGQDGGVVAPQNSRMLFAKYANVEIMNLDFLDTSGTTKMQRIFGGMSGLKELHISKLDTSKVTSMKAMFSDCTSLTNIDISNFNTKKVVDMNGMFYNCISLNNVDLTNLNTSKVIDMAYMFYNCKKLTSLNVSNFNTELVTSMESMFQYCTSLTTISVNNFKTSNVQSMTAMFAQNFELTNLDLGNFETANVKSTQYMFYGNQKLKNLKLDKMTFQSVTQYKGMFQSASSDIYITVKSSEEKNWIQDKLGVGKGTITALN